MATVASPTLHRSPFASDRLERVLAVAAIVLLGFVIVAIAKGRADWARVPFNVWAHLFTMMLGLALTPVMLLRPRGNAPHRALGWVWATAILLSALISFTIRNTNHGGFSIIHILSAWVTIQVPIIVWSARAHNVKRHRRSVRAMVIGALLIAGFFTFPFDRMLGHWLTM